MVRKNVHVSKLGCLLVRLLFQEIAAARKLLEYETLVVAIEVPWYALVAADSRGPLWGGNGMVHFGSFPIGNR